MIATMNGMVTQLNLKADHPGDFYGQSAQFSGAGFSDMHFVLHALSPESFAQWVAKARQSPAGLDAEAYLALARKRATASPSFYGSIDRDLFDKIAARELLVEEGDARAKSAQSRAME